MKDDIYDIIIDIKTFEDLKNNGWEIMMHENGEKKYFKQKEININIVGILGGGNVGKTFILHKLINKGYNEKIKTKGISVIYPDIAPSVVFLDTCNTLNTSLFYEEFIKNLSDKEKLKIIKELNKDKKFRNIFIEDFIIRHSNILIIVINQLSFKEQKFLNRLKNEDFETIFVSHNLQFFCDVKSIEDYIKNTIEKSVFSNLKKIIFTNLDLIKSNENESKKPYYFREKNISGKNYNDNNKI